MSNYHRLFPNKALFCVIHTESVVQTLRNAQIAFGEGADGAFLIDHTGCLSLRDVYCAVRAQYQAEWIGLNFLGRHLWSNNLNAGSIEGLSGLWVDNAGYGTVHGGQYGPSFPAKVAQRLRNLSGFSGIYFGGVAFKYQRVIVDSAEEASEIVPYVDVVTTSGSATGKPPQSEKISQIRKAIGDQPLAIASGMTERNIKSFLGLVDCFLVATGISRSQTELDPSRVRKMARIIHER